MKIIKYLLLVGLLLMAKGTSAAVIYSASSGPLNEALPNGTSTTPVLFTLNLDAPGGSLIETLTVTLSASGGYNSGYYAYLLAPDQTSTVLLNNYGVTESNPFGDMDTTLNYVWTLSKDSPLYGTYASGNWTLAFADTAGGDMASTFNGWSLEATVVPEAVNVSLGILGGGAILLAGIKQWRRSKSAAAKNSPPQGI